MYDALQFDLSFPQAIAPVCRNAARRRALAVPSQAATRFTATRTRPLPRRKEETPKEEPVDIDIDFEGITGRVLGFPVDEGDTTQSSRRQERVLFTRFEVRGIKPAGVRG